MNAFVMSDFERSTSLTLINTTDPAIYISKEFSSDWDFETGAGTWKWVAKRSWVIQGATRTEIFEVPKEAEEADDAFPETVESMIQALTRASSETTAKYVVSRQHGEWDYVAIRIE